MTRGGLHHVARATCPWCVVPNALARYSEQISKSGAIFAGSPSRYVASTRHHGQVARATNKLALLLFVPMIFMCLVAGGCDNSDRPESSSDDQGASTEHFEPKGQTGSMRVTPLVAATAATKPTGPLPADASCVTAECHATFHSAPQIHGPVSEGSCVSCHEPDQGGHKYPLKRAGNALCTFCHSDSGTASHQHKALEQGCGTCHESHVSQTKFLLKADNVEHLCARCHDVPLKPFAHDPFAKGECTTCHQPHQADNAMLLRGGAGAQHCFTCHTDTKAALADAKFVHDPAAKDCTQCHGAHATDNPHILKAPVAATCYSCHNDLQQRIALAPVAHGAMTNEKACANCHSAHASNEPELLKQRTDKICLTCHADPVPDPDTGRLIAGMRQALTESKFLHGPNRVGNCSACHDPHGGQRADLLQRPFPAEFYTSFDVAKYDLCFTCHTSDLVTSEKTQSLTNFRDGDVNLHYLHVHRDEKGRTCKTCHNIHGSNLPRHMASEVPFENSNWSMPIEYQATSDGGSFKPGCHAPRTYRRATGSATTQPTTQMTIRGEP